MDLDGVGLGRDLALWPSPLWPELLGAGEGQRITDRFGALNAETSGPLFDQRLGKRWALKRSPPHHSKVAVDRDGGMRCIYRGDWESSTVSWGPGVEYGHSVEFYLCPSGRHGVTKREATHSSHSLGWDITVAEVCANGVQQLETNGNPDSPAHATVKKTWSPGISQNNASHQALAWAVNSLVASSLLHGSMAWNFLPTETQSQKEEF